MTGIEQGPVDPVSDRPIRVVLATPEHMAWWATRAAAHLSAGPATVIAGLAVIDVPTGTSVTDRLLDRWRSGRWRRPSRRPVRVRWDGPREPASRATQLIESTGADAVVWLADGEPGGARARQLAAAAPVGLFTLRVGRRPIGPRSGLAEVLDEAPLTLVELIRHDRSGAATVIRSGRYGTVPGSMDGNRDAVLDAAARWPEVELRALARGDGPAQNSAAITLPRPVPRIGPSAVWRLARQQLRARLRALCRHDEWNVGIVEDPSPASLLNGRLSITWLPRRTGRYAADPFVARDGDDVHVFFEDYAYRSGRGAISHLRVGPTGAATRPTTVLDPATHVSFPFLVPTGDGLAMVPESSASGQLVLYRPEKFPGHWQPAATLLDEPVLDAAIVCWDGRWWMFGTRPGPQEHAELCVWHAPELEGPWTAHARNPVKVDARSARSAGTPFTWQGRLYRPAQDCSRRYGGRIVILRVDVLSPTDFSESPVATLGPQASGPYPDAMHTLSVADGVAVVDGARTTFSGAEFIRAIRRHLPRASS